MRTVCFVLLAAFGSGLRSRATLQIENAALRHQLAVLQRQSRGRPRLRPVDRLFWTWLRHLWPGWRRALICQRDWALHGRVDGPTDPQRVPLGHGAPVLAGGSRRNLRAAFRACLEAMEIDEVLTAPRSPWQNPYVERLIGSIRRECLDHVIVLNERSARRILRSYVAYYHHLRTHLALGKDAPVSRAVEPAEPADVVAIPHVGGLHHSYHRRAA